MKIIRTYLIPRGYVAMAIWPLILASKGSILSKQIVQHECVHHAQQKEMLIIPFYLWYFIEYLIRLCIYRNHRKAYRNICFEAEAKCNERNPNYLKTRKHYSFLKYF